jgi:hypothetical protein
MAIRICEVCQLTKEIREVGDSCLQCVVKRLTLRLLEDDHGISGESYEMLSVLMQQTLSKPDVDIIKRSVEATDDRFYIPDDPEHSAVSDILEESLKSFEFDVCQKCGRKDSPTGTFSVAGNYLDICNRCRDGMQQGRDNDGQVIIYTGKYRWKDGMLHDSPEAPEGGC